jgi:hypothetical protein
MIFRMPRGSPSSIERRSNTPVEMCGTPNASASNRPCVPFPDAGAPSMVIRTRGR